MINFKCCYKCENRRCGCHSVCEAYKAEKQKQQIKQELIRKQKAHEQDVFMCTTIKAINQKMHYAKDRRAMY